MLGQKCKCYFSAISLGVAFGLVSGLWMTLFAWFAFWWGQGVPIVAQWGAVIPGYAATIQGGLIGGAWGFIEGFIMGLLIAWIYNFCLCCCKGACKPCDMDENKKSGCKTK